MAIKIDAESKMITGTITTPANVHDSQPLPNLIDEKDRVLYAGSAYSGKPVQDKLPASLDCQIHEKGYKNHPPHRRAESIQSYQIQYSCKN